jgi:hypothetical protein
LFEQGGDLGAEPAVVVAESGVVDSELFDAGLGRRVGHSAALAGCGLGGGSEASDLARELGVAVEEAAGAAGGSRDGGEVDRMAGSDERSDGVEGALGEIGVVGLFGGAEVAGVVRSGSHWPRAGPRGP